MEQPNSKQPISASQSECLPITHYFDRCPPEVTLNVLQYADMNTLQRFASIKQFNDAALAEHTSVWRPHIEPALAPFIPQWIETFPVKDDLPDMQTSLITRWQEVQAQEEIVRRSSRKPCTTVEFEECLREFSQKEKIAKIFFKALWSFVKEHKLSVKEVFPVLKSYIEQNFPRILEINLTKAISIQDFLLYAAVEANQVDDVKILLSIGADPFAQYQYNRYSYYYCSIFKLAIKKNNSDIVKAFIDHDCRPEFLSNGLASATSQGNIELIKQLITAGANVNHSENRGHMSTQPCLHRAISYKSSRDQSGTQVEVVKLLLEWGGDVNFSKVGDDAPLSSVINNILHFTSDDQYEVKEEYMTLAKLFIRNGADFNVKAGYSKKSILEELQEIGRDNQEVNTLVDYINTVGKKVQKVIKGSKITDIFNDTDKRSVCEKLIAVLQYYTNPGSLSVGSVSFAFSRLSFHSHSHPTEVQTLLKTLANLGEKASAQQCYDALKTTLEDCQKKVGYDPDGTLALLGELLLAKLKREIGKETLAAREAAIKQREQDRAVEAKSETTEQASSVPTMGKK